MAALLALSCGVAAGEASAGLVSCSPRDDRPCARLAVPIDRSGTITGTVKLRVERYRAKRPARPPIVLLVGDPGQSSAAAMKPPSFGIGWDPIEMMVGDERRRRDVVVMDLRGSGRSGPLKCPELQRGLGVSAVARCAARLGPARDHYAAIDMAEDVEAVRTAIGAERIALLGASYGTHVALTYARRYPTRVERLVLDSPVGPSGVDAFRRSSLNATPRFMDVLCGSSRECASFTRNSGADLRRVATAIERRPLRGRVTAPSGWQMQTSLDGSGLLALVNASVDDPLLAATLPAALRRAALGNSRPLLRAAWAQRRNEATERVMPASEMSVAARVAILCTDTSLPWSATTPRAERPLVAISFAEQIGSGAFAPFSARTAASGELLRSCAEWPSSARSVPPASPLPDLPTLILSGTGDLRAPTEDARALAAQLPSAQLSVVGNAGHPVLGFSSECPTEVVKRFLAARALEPCDDERWWHGVLPPPPSEFGNLPTRGMPPRVGRTMSAVLWTAFDLATAFAQRARPALDDYAADRGRHGLRMRLGALHGGSYVLSPKGIDVRRARVVPGVEVSGRVRLERVHFRRFTDDRVRVRLRLRGRRAAHGWLALRRESVLVGRLGGRRVRFAPNDLHPALQYWSPGLFKARSRPASRDPAWP